jgi:hypothetical protein
MLRISAIILLVILSSFTTRKGSPAGLHNKSLCTAHYHHTINFFFSPYSVREGTAAEKLDAFNKIEAYRTANALTSNTQRGKNIGYVEGSITNGGVTKTFSISNTVAISNSGLSPNPTIFTTSFVNGYDRFTDSEYQMLSLLAKNNYGAVKGSVFSAATGTVKIVSERIYCTSCDNVARVQFKNMFPNVNLIFISGTT